MGMLDGKRAVVTGVGPGLGTEMALGLAREGADVALVARSERVTPEVAAEIEAMRSGRLHVGGFSTGPTAFAVNIAGAVPFAIKK